MSSSYGRATGRMRKSHRSPCCFVSGRTRPPDRSSGGCGGGGGCAPATPRAFLSGSCESAAACARRLPPECVPLAEVKRVGGELPERHKRDTDNRDPAGQPG